MKIAHLILIPAFGVLCLPPALWAQANPAPTSTEPAALPIVPSPNPLETAPTYELSVKWNEKGTNVLTVPFKNDSKQALHVMGVQASPGLFIGDFPFTVAPGKEEKIAFFYSAPDNTDGDLDVIRVLTDQGVREIRVSIKREKAVQFNATTLQWTQGSPALPQTVDFSVTAGTVVPKKLRMLGGANHKADLLNLGQGRYRVVVTPNSTAAVQKFPVFIDYEPALAGSVTVIYCEITPRN